MYEVSYKEILKKTSLWILPFPSNFYGIDFTFDRLCLVFSFFFYNLRIAESAVIFHKILLLQF